MQNKRVLITGSSGLLGGNLCYLFSENGYKVTGVYNRCETEIKGVEYVSINDLKEVSTQFAFVVHCAAKTDVDGCEKDPNSADEINVKLTECLINFANRANAVFLFISTDAVYKDSEKNKDEHFETAPLSIYAKTKLLAEMQVKENAERFIIIRTNIFGINIQAKNSLAEWVMESLKNGQTINGFNDVYFSPILVNDLFDAIKILIENAGIKLNETFNIGAANGISKFQFAIEIANQFQFDASLIKSKSIDDINFVAKRSKNSVMDSSKFEQIFTYKLPTIEQSISNFRRLYVGGYAEKLKSYNKNQNCVNR